MTNRIDDFTSLPPAERDRHIFENVVAVHERQLDQYNQHGELMAAHARLAASLDRCTHAIETAFAGVIHAPASAKAPSLPPPRQPAPSYLDLKDDDITVVRQLKERTKVDMAIRERWATWGRRIVLIGAVVGALGTIGGAVAAGVWWASQHISVTPNTK